MSLGENLRALRKKKGLTQQELADKTGIRLAHISTLESKESDPKLSTLERLLEALDCSPNELLTDEPKAGDTGFKAYLRKAETLPEQDRAIIIEVIRKFVIADNARLLSYANAPDEELIWEAVKEHHGIGDKVAIKDGEVYVRESTPDEIAAEEKAEKEYQKILGLRGEH